MGNNQDIEPDIKRELKWKELAIRIEHYKYYLNIALSVNGFFYVITGGVLGFYLKNPPESAAHPLEYVLLLPILIGAVFGGVFIYGARLQEKAIDSMEGIREEMSEKLGLDIQELQDAHLLNILLRIFGYIFFFVGVALLLVPFKFAANSTEKLMLFSRFETPSDLIPFLTLAILILIGGGFLPIIARLIDNRLRGRRRYRWLKTIKSWLEDIDSMKKDDIPTLTGHPLYRSWLPYLSKKTIESVNDGTFKTEFLKQDIVKLREEWKHKDTRIKTEGLWEWLTAA